jgi:hypothetical protein
VRRQPEAHFARTDARARAIEHSALAKPPASAIARAGRRRACAIGARTTLETQKLALEQLNINKEVLEAQRAGASTMASVTAQMGGVDAVDDTMGQIEEGLADANEIGEALSRPVAGGLDVDDDDLLAELEELEGADLEMQVRQEFCRQAVVLSALYLGLQPPPAHPLTPLSSPLSRRCRRSVPAWAVWGSARPRCRLPSRCPPRRHRYR